tara:strand:+ start:2236 stop:2436 length:201 start_codon:yes stop_codon:yes gene_type:complete
MTKKSKSTYIDTETLKDNNNFFLTAVIDMHKSVNYLIMYMKINKELNQTQHEEVEKRAIKQFVEEK